MTIKGWIYRIGYPCAKLYWYFRRPVTKGIIAAIRHRDDVLLVKHSYRTDAWCLVGGTIENGEDPLDSCVREVFEEVGVQPQRPRWFHVRPWTREYKRDTVYAYEVWSPVRDVTVDQDEVIRAKWFPLSNLPEDLDPLTQEILDEYLELI